MNLLKLCHCLVILITYFLNSQVSSVEIDCESLEKCPFTRNILSKTYVPSQEVWNLLNISKCGYDKETRSPKIWCPKIKNCKTVNDELGTCISKESCTDLATFLKINLTTDLRDSSQTSDCNSNTREDLEILICCPWSEASNKEIKLKGNLEKKELTNRKKRNSDQPWFGYSNNGNSLLGDGGGGQSQFYQVNKNFALEGLNFNLPSLGTGPDNTIFAQQNTNFYDQLKAGQTNQFNQLQNSLQKQNKLFQLGLQNTSKKLSESQRNFSSGLMNSWSWFPRENDYSKYNLTEETSVSIQQICLTPDQFEGTCKQFRQCPSFIKALRDVNNTNSVQIDYLKKFRCNSTKSHDEKYTVCCTDNLIVLPDANSRTVESKAETQGTTSNPLDSFSEICGLQSVDDKIIGGTTTGLAEFPWTAVLYYSTSKGLAFGCGGSIITNRYIVTAAHCVNSIILKQAGLQNLQKVVVGEYDRRNDTDCIYTPFGSDCADPPQSFDIDRIIEHDQFRSNSTPNDIALVRLDRNITFNDFVRPICLPTSSLNLKGNEITTITGWGRTETGESSQVKRKATLPFVSKENCSQLGPLTDGQMCLGSGKGNDSCKGDSGGPVMLYTIHPSGHPVTTLVGIISFGFGRCGTSTSVGTYVPNYMDWILKNIT